jgi:hypothetical protein
MKKYLIVFMAMLAVGVGMAVKPVSASIEDDIMRFLRGLGSQMDVIQRYQGEGTTANMGRFDSIDSKLDRIYESCGRTTTAARRVTSAQVNTCVDACFNNSRMGTAAEGVLDRSRFTSCVARCPSNTLRNIECAEAYNGNNAGVAQVSGEWVYGVLTADAYTRSCTQSRGASQAALCRVVGDLYVNRLKACLFDQAAYTCQSDCTRNYRNDAGAMLCLLRCENRTRAAATYEQLQSSGFIEEDGSLAMDAVNDTVLDSIAASRTVTTPSVAPSTSVQTSVPARETYSQCVYRCGDERTSCIAAPPAGQDCEQNYSTCYQSCNSRLLNNGSAR